MRQRRQDARRAKQERRRAERRESRVAQRRTTATIDRPAPAPAAAAPPASRPRVRRQIVIGGAIAAVVIAAIAFWVYRSVTAPLPGEKLESQGNAHLTDATQPHEPYSTDPPASGPHLPTIPRPGIYTQPKVAEDLGHFMEHGGVWVLYNCPDGCPDDVQAIERLVNRAIDRGRPVALAPYPSMESRYAVVAWQYLLRLDEFDRGQIDDFINRHACRYNPEGGPYCSGVRGKVESDAPQETQQEGTTLPVITLTPFSVFGSPTPAPAGTPAPTATAAP